MLVVLVTVLQMVLLLMGVSLVKMLSAVVLLAEVMHEVVMPRVVLIEAMMLSAVVPLAVICPLANCLEEIFWAEFCLKDLGKVILPCKCSLSCQICGGIWMSV
jgi:hypothetical protein